MKVSMYSKLHVGEIPIKNIVMTFSSKSSKESSNINKRTYSARVSLNLKKKDIFLSHIPRVFDSRMRRFFCQFELLKHITKTGKVFHGLFLISHFGPFCRHPARNTKQLSKQRSDNIFLRHI